jgi:hypothetical protein
MFYYKFELPSPAGIDTYIIDSYSRRLEVLLPSGLSHSNGQ